MLSTIFTIILCGTGVWFFYQSNFWAGAILLVWTNYRLFQRYFIKIETLVELAAHSDLERKCNVSLWLSINVEEVLKHPSVNELFGKLKEKKVIGEIEKGEWIKKLLENYKKKYKSSEGFEQVSCNIKNNLIWKNEKIYFRDIVAHEFYIPYEYQNGEEEIPFLTSNIETHLTISIFIVNGIMKLRVGYFSGEYALKTLRKVNYIPAASPEIYQGYETIASFPLLYCYDYHIPERYLNFRTSANPYDPRWKIWHKKLFQEIRDYNYLCNCNFYACNLANDYNEYKRKWQKYDKIAKVFDKKREEYLKREGFSKDTSGYKNEYLYIEMSLNPNSYI